MEYNELLELAYPQPLVAGLKELVVKEQQIPGAIQYTIKRYNRDSLHLAEDIGVFEYHYQAARSKENHLQLKFCVAGNMYCSGKNCDHCANGRPADCAVATPSLDVVAIKFTATQLAKFVKPRENDHLGEGLLNFKRRQSFSRSLPICSKIKSLLQGLVSHQYEGSIENIFVNAQLHMLLIHSLDCMVGEKEPFEIQCRFLSNDDDKAKITLARNILMQSIGEPITIKEISRKVAMNECYLKKGFKEMFGTTIFEFYQGQRMEHAKYLLYEKGLSVTDVALMLGYSSISHFSTAFKKQTGLKPCELLLR